LYKQANSLWHAKSAMSKFQHSNTGHYYC